MRIQHFPRLMAAAAASLALLASTPHSMAQDSDDKSVVVESVPAFPAFDQWVGTYVKPTPETTPNAASIQVLPYTVIGGAQAAAFEPMPVILGLPELPLLGNAAQAARNWGANLNYQGVFSRLVVLDAGGNRREVRPMTTSLRAGDRFKIRVTATFDAVADIDQVAGSEWSSRRTGQFYPAAGSSVAMKPGETVELPLNPNEYFVMGRSAGERLLLSVRHVKAVQGMQSDQPAYRQDGQRGSSYLQLVPRGKYPVVEQLVSIAR